MSSATTTASYPGLSTPRLWQKWNYILNPVHYLEALGQVAPDIANAPVIGSEPAVLFVSHPDGLQQLFTNEGKQFIAPPNRLLQPLVGDYSIFTLDGQRHRRERKLLMPSFHGDRMRAYGQLICDRARDAIARVPVGESLVMREVAQEISLKVILGTVFGLNDSDRSRAIEQAIVTLTELFRSSLFSVALFFPALRRNFGPFRAWEQFVSLKQRLKILLYDEIRERRERGDLTQTDILTLMLATRDEAGQAMSDEEIHDELFTLLLAGHETTASAIAWAIYWIHHLPEVGDRLRQELQAIDDHTEPTEIARLPYLSALCNETLRIYPIAMLTSPRCTCLPTEILGYPVPENTLLYGGIYITHHNPRLYPEPHRFKPDRFLERQYTPYEFLPFGGGVRRCLGEALAQFELRLVVATITHEFSLQLADDKPEKPVRRGVTLAPERGVRMLRTG